MSLYFLLEKIKLLFLWYIVVVVVVQLIIISKLLDPNGSFQKASGVTIIYKSY